MRPDGASMVLGPFAETKGPRGAGAKPRIAFRGLDFSCKFVFLFRGQVWQSRVVGILI